MKHKRFIIERESRFYPFSILNGSNGNETLQRNLPDTGAGSFSILNGSNGNETYFRREPGFSGAGPFSILNGSNGNETYEYEIYISQKNFFQYPQRIEWQ